MRLNFMGIVSITMTISKCQFLRITNMLPVLYFCTGVSFAGQSQIDVIGIVPGVSTRADVDAKLAKNHLLSYYGIVYVIGGLELICSASYLDNKPSLDAKVSDFSCGWGSDTLDTKNKGVVLNAIDTYKILLEVFSQKFGSPDLAEATPKTDVDGTNYMSHKAFWLDSKANKLSIEASYRVIRSMLNNEEWIRGEGKLNLKSAEKIRDENKHKKREF